MLNLTETSNGTAARKKDSLGCLSNQLHKDIELEAGDFTFYRKCRREEKTSEVATPASDRGFLIGVSLTAGHRRRITSGARSALHDFEKDSVYIRKFEEDYRADLHGSFDFVLVEFSRVFIANTGYERNGSTIRGFSTRPGHKDAIFGHLAQVLALKWPDRAGGFRVCTKRAAKTYCSRRPTAMYHSKRSRAPAICRAATSIARFARPPIARRISACWSSASNAHAVCCADPIRRCPKSRSHAASPIKAISREPSRNWSARRRATGAGTAATGSRTRHGLNTADSNHADRLSCKASHSTARFRRWRPACRAACKAHTQAGHETTRITHADDYRNGAAGLLGYDLMNSSRSAFTRSACVVHIPCGAPS